ncbi:MAG: hypothetical protein CMF96_05195 [Candidatus Marinimicrobia bacterium]|nr:hypothetical protein [Candidatus Neomarinimicrobiota bacterium]
MKTVSITCGTLETFTNWIIMFLSTGFRAKYSNNNETLGIYGVSLIMMFYGIFITFLIFKPMKSHLKREFNKHC